MERSGIDALILGREANARAVSGADRLWLDGHPRVRARLRGRAQLRRGAPARQQRRRLRGLPARTPLPRHLESREAARRAARDPGPRRRAHGRRRRHVAGHARAARASSCPTPRSSTRARSSPSCGASARPRRSRPCTKRHASRATASPRWPRSSATACAPACCAACAPSAFASLGVTTPAFEAVAAPIDGGASTWLPPERLLGEGENVALRAGALRDGWEASLARTYVVGDVVGRAAAARRLGRGRRGCAARARASASSATSKPSSTAWAAASSPTTTTSRSKSAWCSRSSCTAAAACTRTSSTSPTTGPIVLTADD